MERERERYRRWMVCWRGKTENGDLINREHQNRGISRERNLENPLVDDDNGDVKRPPLKDRKQRANCYGREQTLLFHRRISEAPPPLSPAEVSPSSPDSQTAIDQQTEEEISKEGWGIVGRLERERDPLDPHLLFPSSFFQWKGESSSFSHLSSLSVSFSLIHSLVYCTEVGNRCNRQAGKGGRSAFRSFSA